MNQKGWRCFLELCQAATDEKILTELFDLLLTPEEKASLETRCLIIEALLQHKVPQRQLAENLQVSIAKITRGSNELKRITPKLKKFLEQQFLK